MSTIDGEYLELEQQKQQEQSVGDRLVNLVEELALNNYPVHIVRDSDGDSSDANERLRNAFTLGALTVLRGIYG